MELKFFVKSDEALKLMSDEELIKEIRDNNNEKALEFLMDKYKSYVYSHAKTYFIVGAEKQDIIQEGLIGLFKAIKNYSPKEDTTFKSFADLCIRRQIISAIKMSTRQKHIPLNSSVSINSSFDSEDPDDKALTDILENTLAPDPSETIVNKETFINIKSKITSILSEYERKVLDYHLCGYTYTQIAKALDAEPKSIDNAIQRIKKKMEKNIFKDRDLY